MENNKLFKLLWRANAIFLFIAGIGLICLLLMFAALLISDFSGSDAPPPVVSAAVEENRETDDLEIHLPSDYSNWQSSGAFEYFEVRTGRESYSKLGSGSSSQLRNVGVFDLNENTTHWVFPDAQQEIEKHESVGKIKRFDDKPSEQVWTGHVLTVAKSLEDGSISRDVWAMSLGGQDLRKILSNVPRPPEIRTRGQGQKILMIETKTHIDIYPFDVDGLTVGKPMRVSIP